MVESADQRDLAVGVGDPLDDGREDFAEFGADDEEPFSIGL